MAQEKKKNKDQFLVDYVVNLRNLNNKIKIKPPKADIEKIIKDPEEYAKEYVEIAFAKYLRLFKKSFLLGKKLAENLEDGKK